ncbi:hypothetical protein COOONC_02533 [Cooperia oncophora]
MRMAGNCAVVDQLKQFFERCARIEELPHSFDDTLLDSLIDNIDLSDHQLVEFITSKFSSTDFNTATSVVISIILRLYAKYCQSLNTDDGRVAEQLGRSENTIGTEPSQKFPCRSLHSLYTACHHVIFWCVSHLPDEQLSIFVRRKIEDFLCLTEDVEVELILPSVVDLFCCTDSDYVLNGTARILVHFADRLDADQIRCIVNTTQSRGVAGDVVYQLAAKVRPDMTLADDLALNKWHNETARCQTIMKLVQSSPK